MFDQKEWKSRNPLKAWREQHSVTQTTAAAIVGCGVQAMQRWESGASMPSPVSMNEIAQMMGLFEPNDMQKLMREWSAWRDELKASLKK